jgi:hypothetical protein|tara:strand:+ start:1769 stop:1921 length:153 start_codon:yes stop_codon:yes gene_type:complete
MTRTEMIDKILKIADDNFKTKENFLELAKESSYQLMRRLIILKKSNKKQK